MEEHRKYIRQVYPFKDYFKDFKKGLKKDVILKIYQVFMLIMTEEFIPSKFLRSIEGQKNLYEIRIEVESNIYRIFCCFDE